MKSQLYELFIDELEDMLSCESQILDSLPTLIKLASLDELKEALSGHYKETEHQVRRLEKIFHMIKLTPKKKICEAMKGILKEADEIVKNKQPSAVLDAAIISAAQKVEHYEIASYGTLRSFATHLEMDGDIIDLIQEILDEEGAADKKLTKIGEGTLFSSGVNADAAEMTTSKKSH